MRMCWNWQTGKLEVLVSSLACGFKSRHPHQKSTGFDLSIFYPLRKQWYIITRKRASHHRRCISSAAGCISFRNDDIQNFVLMICNSCGIDDIHGFRRDLCKSSNSYSIMPKIFFYPSRSRGSRSPTVLFILQYAFSYDIIILQSFRR